MFKRQLIYLYSSFLKLYFVVEYLKNDTEITFYKGLEKIPKLLILMFSSWIKFEDYNGEIKLSYPIAQQKVNTSNLFRRKYPCISSVIIKELNKYINRETIQGWLHRQLLSIWNGAVDLYYKFESTLFFGAWNVSLINFVKITNCLITK